MRRIIFILILDISGKTPLDLVSEVHKKQLLEISSKEYPEYVNPGKLGEEYMRGCILFEYDKHKAKSVFGLKEPDDDEEEEDSDDDLDAVRPGLIDEDDIDNDDNDEDDDDDEDMPDDEDDDEDDDGHMHFEDDDDDDDGHAGPPRCAQQ